MDNLLAERLTRALSTAEERERGRRGRRLHGLRAGTGCWWWSPARRRPASPRRSAAASPAWRASTSGALLVFADGERMVRYADYRGRGEFAGLPRPVAELRARGGGLPRPRSGDLPAAMTRLDELDLSLDLSKKEEAARLEAAQERLLELRLTLGGPDRREGARAAAVRRLRGRRRVRQGRRDQAPRRPARSPPRARRLDRRADVRREAPSLPVALLAAAARLGRDGGARPLLVRARAGRARGGVRRARPSGGAPTTRSTTSSAASSSRG